MGHSPDASRITQAQSLTSGHVYNANYKGPTYAVKYLGIVDGTMGILSRKMAMGGSPHAPKPYATTAITSADLSPLRSKGVPATADSVQTEIKPAFAPVLKGRNYC